MWAVMGYYGLSGGKWSAFGVHNIEIEKSFLGSLTCDMASCDS